MVAALAACSPTADGRRLDGRGLGTTWHVEWAGPAPIAEDDIAGLVVAALEQVDASMSTWRDDSELSVARRAGGPVPVSEGTAAVVAEALALAAATGGAFDPTVQPLVELWGLHGDRRTTWPTDDELAAARATVDWRRVSLSRDADLRPTLDAGGTALDLSAIAKGYAVDRISDALSAHGVADHLVEVGGEVVVRGRAPDGDLWRVGVERPDEGAAPGSDFAAVLAVTNVAVATSGNYRQRYVVDGREVHHTLDPRTGLPAASPARSATVVAPRCSTADGLATALMVLGEAGLPLVEAMPGAEAWLLVDVDGALKARATSGMVLHLVTDSTAPVVEGRR